MRYLVLALCLAAGAAQAENGTDPEWPCVQRKQPNLSLGQMWSGPEPDEAARDLARTPGIAALADRLEQRRLPLAEAEAEIAEFAKTADNQQLTALVVAIFDRRVISKQYGQMFLSALPACTVRQGRLSDLPAEALDWLGEG